MAEMTLDEAIASIRAHSWYGNTSALLVVSRYARSHGTPDDMHDMFIADMSDSYDATVSEYCDIAERIRDRNA